MTVSLPLLAAVAFELELNDEVKAAEIVDKAYAEIKALRADLPPTREQLAALVKHLEWEGDAYGEEATTDHGTYEISGTDSLGKVEAYFHVRGTDTKVFVCYAFGTDEAKKRCQKHHAWLALSAFDIPEGV